MHLETPVLNTSVGDLPLFALYHQVCRPLFRIAVLRFSALLARVMCVVRAVCRPVRYGGAEMRASARHEPATAHLLDSHPWLTLHPVGTQVMRNGGLEEVVKGGRLAAVASALGLGQYPGVCVVCICVCVFVCLCGMLVSNFKRRVPRFKSNLKI